MIRSKLVFVYIYCFLFLNSREGKRRIIRNDRASVMMEAGIVADQSRSLWALVTEHSTYALGVTKEGLVINLHWGPRLATLADLPDPRLALTHSSHDPALTSIAEEY